MLGIYDVGGIDADTFSGALETARADKSTPLSATAYSQVIKEKDGIRQTGKMYLEHCGLCFARDRGAVADRVTYSQPCKPLVLHAVICQLDHGVP